MEYIRWADISWSKQAISETSFIDTTNAALTPQRNLPPSNIPIRIFLKYTQEWIRPSHKASEAAALRFA